MVSGYDDVCTNVSESIKIMGISFYAENIQADEPFNRREREFTPLLSGTERINQGKYIHREYNFTTTWFFPTGRPDVYNKLFKEMMSKPVEVISQYMGGKFQALVNISQSFPENSPNHMELDITVTEVPGVKSNIPGESFTVPKVKKITTTVKSKKKTSSSKNKSKTNKSKTKTKTVKKKNK